MSTTSFSRVTPIMENEQLGIENLKETIADLNALLVKAVKIGADGFQLSDLTDSLGALTKLQDLLAELPEAKLEANDLDREEIYEIAHLAVELIKNVHEAFLEAKQAA